MKRIKKKYVYDSLQVHLTKIMEGGVCELVDTNQRTSIFSFSVTSARSQIPDINRFKEITRIQVLKQSGVYVQINDDTAFPTAAAEAG